MEIKDCCCKDIHRDTCYAIRYPNYNPDPLSTDSPETCECPCHDQYDEEECDCMDCTYPTEEDKEEFRDDYELMKQLADNEVRAREQDARDRERELRQRYPSKNIEDGNWED